MTDTASHTQYNLRAEVQFVDSGEHYTVALHDGPDGNGNLTNWYTRNHDETLAHELGHQLGLKDEYIDARAPDRATAASPGVHTDQLDHGQLPRRGPAGGRRAAAPRPDDRQRDRRRDRPVLHDLTAAMIQVLTAWLAPALVAACSEPSKPQTAPRQEASAMDDPLRAFDRHPTATVTIRFGTEYFGKGEVTLAVRGDRAVSVEQRAAGAVTRYSAQLDGARIVALGRVLGDHRFTAPRTSTLPRNPGDTRLVLRLSGAGVPAFETTIWYGDRFADRDLDAILRAADDVLHTASGGKLGEPARVP